MELSVAQIRHYYVNDEKIESTLTSVLVIILNNISKLVENGQTTGCEKIYFPGNWNMGSISSFLAFCKQSLIDQGNIDDDHLKAYYFQHTSGEIVLNDTPTTVSCLVISLYWNL
jgi:hypothetical protein